MNAPGRGPPGSTPDERRRAYPARDRLRGQVRPRRARLDRHADSQDQGRRTPREAGPHRADLPRGRPLRLQGRPRPGVGGRDGPRHRAGQRARVGAAVGPAQLPLGARLGTQGRGALDPRGVDIPPAPPRHRAVGRGQRVHHQRDAVGLRRQAGEQVRSRSLRLGPGRQGAAVGARRVARRTDPRRLSRRQGARGDDPRKTRVELRLDPEREPVTCRLWALARDGHAPAPLARILNSAGLRTRAGRAWTRRRVQDTLENAVYAGPPRSGVAARLPRPTETRPRAILPLRPWIASPEATKYSRQCGSPNPSPGATRLRPPPGALLEHGELQAFG